MSEHDNSTHHSTDNPTDHTGAAEVDPVAAADPADAVDPRPLGANAPVKDESPAFGDFDVRPQIVADLAGVGITKTFAIQEMTLPIALAGADLIGQARTGTGKTLGFGVPLLSRLNLPEDGPVAGAAPQALVIAPTRELAVQVSGDLAVAGRSLGARVLTIYGGRAYEPQLEALRKGVDVVVGTPGRLLDLAQQGALVLGNVRCLVLDEADEMLDLGFLPDIEKLLAMVPAQRQTLLFSATMPGPIVALARQFMNQPVQIRAEGATDTPAIEHVDQFVYRAHAMDKVELLARVLQSRDRGLTMIFTRTKRTAQKVADELVDRGFAAAAVHGDLGQGAREQALRAFRTGKIDVLVATDVAARGLDVEGVTHVVNYQCPEDEKIYVHRIGRTARAGASGTAVTLVDWDDLPKWKLICDQLGLPMHEPAETYSTSPHLYLELDIPEGVTGRLPRAARTRAGLDAEEVEDLGGPDSRQRGRSAGRGSDRGGSDRGGSDRGGSDRGGDGRGGAGGSGRGGRGRSSRPRGGERSGSPSSASSGSASSASGSSGDGSGERRRRRSRGGAASTAGDGGTQASADRSRRPRRRTRGGTAAARAATTGTAAGGTTGTAAD